MRWLARRSAEEGSPTWLYWFSYVRRSQRSKVPGASHRSEIPYVFASWDKISRSVEISSSRETWLFLN